MTPTDAAFLKAITTIKSISRGPNALGKPPLKRKVQLYGLYKQATEGDVEGMMPRPEGDDPQSKANQMKWDAWKSQQGKSKHEAKLLYVGYLLETMHSLAPDLTSSDLPPQWLELEELYQNAQKVASEAGPPATQAPNTSTHFTPHSGPHSRRLSIGSVNSSYSHFLRNNPAPSPYVRNSTFSEFGLSEKDRNDLQADQLVDRLQSVYPPVIPGAVPAQFPFGGELWPPRAKQLAKEGDEGDGPRGPSSHWTKKMLWKAYIYVYGVAESLLRRFIVDTVAIVSVLIFLRVLANRPHVLQKSPVLQRVMNTLIKISAVILDGFGVELRLKKPSSRIASRALQASR